MENKNAPVGLAMSRGQAGYLSGALRTYYVPSTNTTDLFIGDPVVKTGSSNASEIGGFASGMLPAVKRPAEATSGSSATAAEDITGVIMSILPIKPWCNDKYVPKGTEAIILVQDDLSAKFTIQADGEVTADMIGSNADVSFAKAGDKVTGLSGATLKVASVGTEAAKQLKIMGFVDYPTQKLGDYAVLEVMINKSTETHNTTGI